MVLPPASASCQPVVSKQVACIGRYKQHARLRVAYDTMQPSEGGQSLMRLSPVQVKPARPQVSTQQGGSYGGGYGAGGEPHVCLWPALHINHCVTNARLGL